MNITGIKLLVSPDLISRVTDEVMEEVRDWQGRPLGRSLPSDYIRPEIKHLSSLRY
jgi:transposase-like protein